MVSFLTCMRTITKFFPVKERYPGDPMAAIHWIFSLIMRDMLSFDHATTASRERNETQTTFKSALKKEYNQPDMGNLFDMATGQCLPHSVVVASYIFQHQWQNRLSDFTTLEDINDVRNGLLLYKPVQWAFNRAKLCIEVDADGKMTFRLFDQDLRDVELADKACELQNAARHGSQRLEAEKTLYVTFGDLDGRQVHFPEGVEMRPSKQLLGVHAVAAQLTAQHKSPRERITNVAFNTSDDETTEQALRNLMVLRWREDVLVSVR